MNAPLPSLRTPKSLPPAWPLAFPFVPRLKGLWAVLIGLGLTPALLPQARAAGSLDLLREVSRLELLPPTAYSAANTAPTPSSLRRTQSSDPDQPLPHSAVPPGPTVEVRGFRISGARQVPEAELQAHLSDALGRRLDFTQLQALTQRLRGVYARRGIEAVEVILPRQKAQGGLIEIVISEGRIGRSALITAHPDDEATLRAWTPAMQSGQPLDLDEIEQNLVALSTLEGLSSEVRLAPGEQPGSSDLTLEAHRTQAWRGEIDYDNSNALIGAPRQLRARADWLNPTRLGSRLQASLDAGESGLRRLRLTGGLQHADGSGFEAELGGLDFRADHPVSGEFPVGALPIFQPNHQQGRGLMAALQLTSSYRLGASHRQHTRVRLEWLHGIDELTSSWTNQAVTLPAGTGLQQRQDSISQTSRSVSFGLDDQMRRDDGLRRTLDLALTLGYFDGQAIPWADRPGQQIAGSYPGGLTAQKDSSGSYTRLLGRGALSQPFAPGWSFQARGDLQWSTGALPHHEQLRLGGPEGVRAYALDEQRADQGLRASVEARRSTGRIDGFVFADIGWGMAKASLDQRQFAAPEWFNLAGAGVGFEVRPTAGTTLNTQFAWKLDVSPTEMRPLQFWFTLKQSF